MGTWGNGIFDNDGALDFVGGVTEQFASRIETVMASAGFYVDEQGPEVVLPCVALLTLLCDHARSAPPKPTRIALWRERYLALYDKGEAEAGPEYRAIIEIAFRELETRAHAFWDEDDASLGEA